MEKQTQTILKKQKEKFHHEMRKHRRETTLNTKRGQAFWSFYKTYLPFINFCSLNLD